MIARSLKYVVDIRTLLSSGDFDGEDLKKWKGELETTIDKTYAGHGQDPGDAQDTVREAGRVLGTVNDYIEHDADVRGGIPTAADIAAMDRAAPKWVLCQACNTFHAEDESCPECNPAE